MDRSKIGVFRDLFFPIDAFKLGLDGLVFRNIVSGPRLKFITKFHKSDRNGGNSPDKKLLFHVYINNVIGKATPPRTRTIGMGHAALA